MHPRGLSTGAQYHSYYSIIRRDEKERYQNGDRVQPGVKELPMVHATRPEFISRIMREGVTATTKSHGATGLWCHLQTPESEKWSHDWGRTPLDVFSGCYIGVRTPEDSFDLKASKGTCSRISCKRSWPIELDASCTHCTCLPAG